jgi:hypothetical protein
VVTTTDPWPEPTPLLVAFGEPARQRRLSVVVRPFLALPHLLALAVAAPSVLLVVAVGWLWALVVGRLPLFAEVILSGYLRWQTRVLAYLLFLTDAYPPFSLADSDYPVRVTARSGELNRWAVLLRPVLALPALAVGAIAAAGSAIVLLVTWVTTAVTGRLPSSLHQSFAAFVRYQTRLTGYLNMVTSQYPWGLLGDPETGGTGGTGALATAVRPTVWVDETPVRRPTPPSPMRDPYWRLVLSSGAKNNVVLFLILGVAAVVALNLAATVSRFDQFRTEQAAATHILNAYGSLSASVLLYQGQTRSCSDAVQPLPCLTGAAQSVSDAFTVFVHRLATTIVPSPADAARRVLITDGTDVETDFANLSSSTSAGHYELIIESSDLPRLLSRFDRDYQTLGARLTT